MIASIFKPSRRKGGKRVQGRIYWGQVRLSPRDPIERFSLETSDKRVAEKRLAEIVREREHEAAGILAPKPQREAACRAMEHHVADFLADQRAKRRSTEHLKHLRLRLGRLTRECGWGYPKDVSPDSFIAWRSRQKLSAKTLNEYLSTAHSFMDWMRRSGRTAINPLAEVERVETRGKETLRRRALRDEEVRRLLDVAGKRRIIYLTALHTGLRYGELAALEWGDVVLDAPRPFVRVRASTTKNRKDAMLFLIDELADELRAHKPRGVSEGDKVFAKLMPVRRTWRADFDKAGIPRRDETGRQADFHALRHTLASNLARCGVAPRLAMEFMRHSDMRLTNRTYTDASVLPMAELVDRLPRFAGAEDGAVSPPGSAGRYAQRDAQSLCVSGHEASRPVTNGDGRESPKTPEKQGVCRDLAPTGTCSQNPNKQWSRGESNPRAVTVRPTPLRV